MAFVIPQVSLQRVIQLGIAELRQNRAIFDQIFEYYTIDELANVYGTSYIDGIWDWFTETKVPVVQAWSFDPQRMPQISIHLSSETEDQTKAAIGDHFGISDETESSIGTGVFTVNLDIGIHTNKNGDYVLWLYYIINYILFKHKTLAENMGMKLQTFSATDYNKESQYMADNVWSRWIRFRCTVENMWSGAPFNGPYENINLNLDAELESGEIVDICDPGIDIDPTM